MTGFKTLMFEFRKHIYDTPSSILLHAATKFVVQYYYEVKHDRILTKYHYVRLAIGELCTNYRR
jgi:hypothetical protein